MGFENSKVIGIVGGMGPKAGIALYEAVISQTQATTDQQHLPVVLMSFPGNIVDRTLFLEGRISPNPAYEIAKVIRKLTMSGAQIIGIACNTSYSSAIFDVIESEMDRLGIRSKLLNMPLEVCNYISKNHSEVSRIGLMTTNGVYKSQLYKTMLEDKGYEVVIPDLEFQNEVIHRLIYDPQIGIKANSSRISEQAKLLCNEAMEFFRMNDAEAVVLGCTELSLVLSLHDVDGMYIIDSTKCLAKALIREATANDIAEMNALKTY
ncbi:MAG: aspartate racemase [Marivirga sp.]|nr:aspartate racemase [Marivirga sp.]